MDFDNAKDAYTAVSRMLKEFEKNLGPGEYVGVSGMGPNSREFAAQRVTRYRNLISIVGTDDSNNFCELIFSPDQISLSVFTIKDGAPRQPIGFYQE